MLQARTLHTEQLKLLGELAEQARGTDAVVTRIDEKLLEVALGKTLGDRDKTGEDARSIATEVAALINADGPSLAPSSAESREVAITDPEAHARAQERFSVLPSGNLESAIEDLESLTPKGLAALREYAQDEIKYQGTNYAVGLTPRGDDRRELLRRDLIEPEEYGLAELTPRGRDAAAALLADEDAPSDLAARLVAVRGDIG
jgi:hypothetical protein